MLLPQTTTYPLMAATPVAPRLACHACCGKSKPAAQPLTIKRCCKQTQQWRTGCQTQPFNSITTTATTLSVVFRDTHVPTPALSLTSYQPWCNSQGRKTPVPSQTTLGRPGSLFMLLCTGPAVQASQRHVAAAADSATCCYVGQLACLQPLLQTALLSSTPLSISTPSQPTRIRK